MTTFKLVVSLSQLGRFSTMSATRLPTFADGIRIARRALRLRARNISCPENAISVANAGRTPPALARQGASALQNGHTVQRGAAPCISVDANLRRRQGVSKYLPG